LDTKTGSIQGGLSKKYKGDTPNHKKQRKQYLCLNRIPKKKEELRVASTVRESGGHGRETLSRVEIEVGAGQVELKVHVGEIGLLAAGEAEGDQGKQEKGK